MPTTITTHHLRLTIFGLVLSAAGWPAPTWSDAVPTPTSIQADADERVARLRWNEFPQWPSANPEGVYGYRISWGPKGGPLTNHVLAAEPLCQLEPLLPGSRYEAQIVALDHLGRASAATPRFAFEPNPARVQGLRDTMNGFFDDFDLPEGAPDERKWNVAWSMNNESARNGFFVTPRHHAHTTLRSFHADRAQAIARPRTPFDFTGRTGTIVFDFDGVLRRDHWYLDLMTNRIDITSHVNAGGSGRGDPVNTLRFRQSGSKVEIVWIGPTGEENVLADSGWDLVAHGVQLVKHVRQPWKVYVSRTNASVWINGRRVVETPLNLPFENAWIHFSLFSYNSEKSNFEQSMADWDNFGFDAPTGAPRIVTHNYTTRVATGAEYLRLFNHQAAAEIIRIPDALTGATAARLMFTMQMMPHDYYAWSTNDRVSLNGTWFPIPRPRSGALPDTSLVGVLQPWTVEIPIDPASLVIGDNTLEFRMGSSGAANIHIEVDYPAGTEPAYTQPNTAWGASPRPTPPKARIGPSVYLARVNTTETWPFMSGPYQGSDDSDLSADGLLTFDITISEENRINGVGVYAGIARVEMLLDGEVIETRRTDVDWPTPGGDHSFTLDSRRLSNGLHRVAFRAWNSEGDPSVPDHFEANASSGQVRPVHLTIANPPPSYATWATTYFGGTNAPSADRARDDDHDGLSNEEEFLLGGNPTTPDAASVLPRLQYQSDDLIFRYHKGDPNSAYRVATTPNLTSSTWPTETTGPERFDNLTGDFYRIIDRDHSSDILFLRLVIIVP